MMDFKIEDPEGNESTVNAQQVASQMAEHYQGVKLSPDGTSIQAVDPATGEMMETDLSELVGEKYGKVKSFAPTQGAVDYGGVNKTWRAAVEALPNDPMVRKAYLQSKLEGMGIKDRKIIGEGEDYYTYNPQTGKYSALTNKPGLDMSDVAGFGPSLVRGLGSTLGMTIGGAGGAVAGPIGAVAGGAAGAGTGGFVADEAMRKVGRWIDPDFDSAMGNMSEEQQSSNRKEQMTRGAVDTLTGGVLRVPGVSNVIGKLNPLSYLAKGTGGAARATGTAANAVGSLVSEPGIARSVGTSAVTGLNAVQRAGSTLRLPELPAWLANKGGQLAEESVANSTAAGKAPGAFASKASEFFGGLNAKAPQKASQSLGSSIERAMGGTPAEEVLQKKAAEAANRAFQTGSEETINAAKKATGKALDAANRTNVQGFYKNAGQKLGQYFDKRALAKGNKSNYAKSFEKAGAATGEVAGAVSTIGRGLENVAEGTLGAAGKTLKYGGKATAAGGRALQSVGNVTAPIEGRLLFNQGAQKGAEELQTLDPRQLRKLMQSEKYNY